MVRLLIRNGANFNIENQSGMKPLDLANSLNHLDIKYLLIGVLIGEETSNINDNDEQVRNNVIQKYLPQLL